MKPDHARPFHAREAETATHPGDPVTINLMLDACQHRSSVVLALRDQARARRVGMTLVDDGDSSKVAVSLVGDPVDTAAAADSIIDWWVRVGRRRLR